MDSTYSRSSACTRNMVGKAPHVHPHMAFRREDKLLNSHLLLSAGPIIRVTPEELSIDDPDFYNEVYVTSSKRRTDSYDVFCLGLDFDGEWVKHLLLSPSHRRQGYLESNDFELQGHIL